MKKLTIKKVLIALDYDETSIKVAEQGYAMAKAMNAEVVLLHVISEHPVYYSSYIFLSALNVDIEKDLKKSALKFLEKAKNNLGDTSITTIIKEGDVDDNILKTVKQLDIDAIIMGSHSRRWLENIVMGSQAAAVLKKATIPLIIIPTKKKN
ncbi:MAG: universal stress protein [Bacteroidales bacterium]|nr:universal stress protein [Bacteroidales bacterium]